MHKRILSLALTSAFSLGIALAAPQDQPQDQGAPPAGRRGAAMQQAMNPDARLKMMTRQLNLSPDQATQIKPILVDGQSQMEGLRSDTSMSREDKMAKMKSIREDADIKIKAILTDDQKTKYVAMQQQMRERMQQRMQQRQSGDGSTPNQ